MRCKCGLQEAMQTRTVGFFLPVSDGSEHPNETCGIFDFLSEYALDSQPNEHAGPITASSGRSVRLVFASMLSRDLRASMLSREPQPLSAYTYCSVFPSSSDRSELTSCTARHLVRRALLHPRFSFLLHRLVSSFQTEATGRRLGRRSNLQTQSCLQHCCDKTRRRIESRCGE